MRLEFEHNSSAAVPFAENDVVSQDVSSEVERMFREGVRAAQEGKRSDARNLLLRVTESDANNENAWLWLASISEYPEELMVFLSNVLRINPENERALEWNRATKSLLAKTLVQRGMDAAAENRRDFARQCFEQALEHEAENEMAWLWMASIADSEVERTVCFERVLKINPENETAQTSLKLIQSQITAEMFQEALAAAFDGRQDSAKNMLETVLSRDAELEDAWVLKSHLAASFEERAECFLKLRVLNPENEMAKANLASWRMLADKLAAQPKTEEFAEPAVSAAGEPAFPALFAADFSHEAVSNDEESSVSSNDEEVFASNDDEEVAGFNEAEQEFAPEFSAECETPNAALEFSDAAVAGVREEASSVSEQENSFFEQPPEFVSETPAYEEFSLTESPTQDLSAHADDFRFDSTQFDAPVAAVEESAPADFAPFEFSNTEFAAAENLEAEKDHAPAEFQADQVPFEMPQTHHAAPDLEVPEAELESATEAEEAEMNWAFTARGDERVEDYFESFDDSESDIHKTQQADYDAEDFAPEFSSASETATMMMQEDAALSAADVAEAPAEEWRNTAPEVFVNYAPAAQPENFFEAAPSVAFFAAEEPVAAPVAFETSPVAFEAAEASPVAFEAAETFAAAEPFGHENNYAPEFTAEAPAAAEFSMSEEKSADLAMEEKHAPKAETVLCPFCDAINEKQAFSCNACHTVLTLSDLEMLLAQQDANADQLRRSVESMERENESYGLAADQLMNLGVGHINLKNYRQGFLYLQEAVRLNPSNVLLDAQVNSLAIRLSEMEEQQTAHDLMSKNRKILVVDDSPTVRKLISGKLEKCGHEVVCAVDGADALEKIKDLKPDLVLLDITMPRMDGYQVCKHIRSDEETKDVPVVMISGKDGFFDKVRGRMAGTSGYITKPFGPETLMKTVETYLN